MASFDERLRRLVQRMARLDVPSLDEVGAAFGRVTERALARFRGVLPTPYEGRREGDRDVMERWARAEGVDLNGLAEDAKQKLRNVDRRQP